MGTDETSSNLTASSGLQTIEKVELVMSHKEELVPRGFKGTFSTPEIEEEGVESSDLSKREVKRNNFNIRGNINKGINATERTEPSIFERTKLQDTKLKRLFIHSKLDPVYRQVNQRIQNYFLISFAQLPLKQT
jgi:hypothetical protein